MNMAYKKCGIIYYVTGLQVFSLIFCTMGNLISSLIICQHRIFEFEGT